MFPCTASMHAALGEAAWIPDYEESTYDFWVSLHPMYGLSMSHMADQALKRYHSECRRELRGTTVSVRMN